MKNKAETYNLAALKAMKSAPDDLHAEIRV